MFKLLNVIYLQWYFYLQILRYKSTGKNGSFHRGAENIDQCNCISGWLVEWQWRCALKSGKHRLYITIIFLYSPLLCNIWSWVFSDYPFLFWWLWWYFYWYYFHNQIGNMIHKPLFKFGPWNIRMHCISCYVFIITIIWRYDIINAIQPASVSI